MGTRCSQGFAAFVLLAAFAASVVSAQTVSVDLLRHPISPKVRTLLLQAIEKMESGDHETAIAQLRETLSKYPDSAPYVHNLLGVEYVKTDRFETAVRSFEQAACCCPTIR